MLVGGRRPIRGDKAHLIWICSGRASSGLMSLHEQDFHKGCPRSSPSLKLLKIGTVILCGVLGFNPGLDFMLA